jgi:rsbT antagonist protein RsbS
MSSLDNFISNSAMNTVERCLILTLPQDIDEDVIKNIKKDLLNRIMVSKLIGVIMDFGTIKIMDSYEFNEFLEIIKMVRLLGLETVCVGFQPGVVSALVDMNVNTDGLTTFLNAGDGLEYLRIKNSFQGDDEEYEDENDEYAEEDDTDE